MKPFECHGCKWFYVKELKGFKEFYCTYALYHRKGMKPGRCVGIHRIKSCNRNEKL